MRLSSRLERIPPYLFAELDKKIEEKVAGGADVISFAVGDPDIPPPEHVRRALIAALDDPAVHKYPSYKGSTEFREAVARYYDRTWGVKVDPESEVLALIGSKEGIAHLPLAVCSEGDVVIVPDPCYPVYEMSALIAGAGVVRIPLRPESGFLPDLDAIDEGIAERARLLWLNYPNNPTAAVADVDFLERVVDWARRRGVAVAYDNAYAEICFDGYRAPSILQVEGASEVAIEFLSFSKTFGMAGWRIGMAVGSAELVAALGQIKTNIDSGIFGALQAASVAALDGPWDFVAYARQRYGDRSKMLVDGLRSLWCPGLAYPKATLYVWAPVPEGFTSGAFAEKLLEDCDVVVVPGAGYGEAGEGFVRFSVTVDEKRIQEGIERIAKVVW